MAGAFEAGSSILVKTEDVDDAKLRLLSAFDVREISPKQQIAFELDFCCVTFETASFVRWQFSSATDVAVTFPRHFICMVLNGSLAMGENGRTVVLKGTQAAIIPPSTQRLHWAEGTTLAGILIMEPDFRREVSIVQPSSASVRLGGVRQFSLAAHPGKAFSELVEFLLADMENGQSWESNRTVRLLFDRLIAYSLLRVLKEKTANHQHGSTDSIAPRHVKHAEEYIRTHLSEPLDNALLASVVEVSSRSLYRAFLNFRGISPARYIQDLRLEAAHSLLVSGASTRDIREVAASTGFKSYPAFWRSYVRKFGIPPSKARGLRGPESN